MSAAARRWFKRLGGGYSLLLALSLAACLALRGIDVTLEAAGDSLLLVVRLVPIFIGALIVGGLVQALLPRDIIGRWLGSESGIKGLAIGSVAGLLTPGGPFIAFPLVIALFNAGADIGALMAFVTAWATMGLHRIVIWDMPLLGFDIAALRFLVSIPLPLIAGWVARRIAPAIMSPDALLPGGDD